MNTIIEVHLPGGKRLKLELSTADLDTHSYFSDRLPLWEKLREQVRVDIVRDTLREEGK